MLHTHTDKYTVYLKLLGKIQELLASK